MAKEIPYFKFFTGEYLTGDITLCSIKTQGIFINLCCYYWNKQGHYLIANVKNRFPNYDNEITELIDKNIIKLDDNNIRIDFLDAQLKERAMLHKLRSDAGRKGGSVKRLQASDKQTGSNAKPIRKEKKRKDKKREEDKGIPSVEILQLWNDLAKKKNLPVIQKITTSRRDKFNTRYNESSFDYIKILSAIESSDFLCGDNDRNWKAEFDWVVINDTNYVKILEGKYKDKIKKSNTIKMNLGA